jgi:hypothetical protein
MNEFSDTASFERYRFEVISSWPESDAKRALLESARTALQRELASVETRRVLHDRRPAAPDVSNYR